MKNRTFVILTAKSISGACESTCDTTRLGAPLVDIAIHGASGRMTRCLLRQAMNRLDKHKRQAERSITAILTTCDRDRYAA